MLGPFDYGIEWAASVWAKVPKYGISIHHCNGAKVASGILPFLGYHHILMILIAIAIILLCKSLSQSLLLYHHPNRQQQQLSYSQDVPAHRR